MNKTYFYKRFYHLHKSSKKVRESCVLD